jgi:hypothetical protein
MSSFTGMKNWHGVQQYQTKIGAMIIPLILWHQGFFLFVHVSSIEILEEEQESEQEYYRSLQKILDFEIPQNLCQAT